MSNMKIDLANKNADELIPVLAVANLLVKCDEQISALLTGFECLDPEEFYTEKELSEKTGLTTSNLHTLLWRLKVPHTTKKGKVGKPANLYKGGDLYRCKQQQQQAMILLRKEARGWKALQVLLKEHASILNYTKQEFLALSPTDVKIVVASILARLLAISPETDPNKTIKENIKEGEEAYKETPQYKRLYKDYQIALKRVETVEKIAQDAIIEKHEIMSKAINAVKYYQDLLKGNVKKQTTPKQEVMTVGNYITEKMRKKCTSYNCASITRKLKKQGYKPVGEERGTTGFGADLWYGAILRENEVMILEVISGKPLVSSVFL